jgi:serine/threonine protein kinase
MQRGRKSDPLARVEEVAVEPAVVEEQIMQEEPLQANRATALFASVIQAALSYGKPVNLPYSAVNDWTTNFDVTNKIGEGAFGSVFKGMVKFNEQQELPVAIKRVNAEGIASSLLLQEADRGGENPFLKAIQREINVLSAFHHPNIIRLIGYCLPPVEDLRASERKMKELCLVYELAPLGGMNTVLRNDEIASQLSWKSRLEIAVGISRGLTCMHNLKVWVPCLPQRHKIRQYCSHG